MVSVNTIQSGTVFAWFMLLMLIRRIVILVVNGLALRANPSARGSRAPEDNKLLGGTVDVTTATSGQVEFPTNVRANRTIANDTENDPYFLILLLATAVFSDGVSGNCTRTIVYGLLYLIIRSFYAVAYIMALQPWRSIVFGFGLAVTLACSLDLVITMSLRAN